MFDRILVPVDGSATADRALAAGAELSRLCGARLRLLHVVDPLLHTSGFETPAVYLKDCVPAMQHAGAELLERAQAAAAAAGVADAETALRTSRGARVAELIVDEAKQWGAALVVIGTHGRRGLDRALLGSDAERVARSAPMPVLLVRP
jgi:nucleotide-binding universal stress UspA family protein